MAYVYTIILVGIQGEGATGDLMKRLSSAIGTSHRSHQLGPTIGPAIYKFETDWRVGLDKWQSRSRIPGIPPKTATQQMFLGEPSRFYDFKVAHPASRP